MLQSSEDHRRLPKGVEDAADSPRESRTPTNNSVRASLPRIERSHPHPHPNGGAGDAAIRQGLVRRTLRQRKSDPRGVAFSLAERAGFEPAVDF